MFKNSTFGTKFYATWATTLVLALICLALPAAATVTVTATTNAATLAATVAAANGGITLTGAPTLTMGSSTTSSGTFTTTGSNLGIASGIVLSTGNVSQISGAAPGPGNISNGGSAISNGGTNEFDIGTFTFSFIPKAGVNKMSIASVFTSEEYNEYVNTAFTDNFSMLLNGGAYTNFNIATVPGTATGTDINSVNNGSNAGYYRDNTVSPYPIPDIKYDGATTVFINAFTVVPGTTYTLTIRIADVGDNQYDSSVFVSTSTILNNPPSLDLSAAASGTGYTTTWLEGGSPIPVAAGDDAVSDDGTTISSATLTLASPLATDLLSVIGSLPGGITASSYNTGTGVITLSGVATLAQYQSALQQIGYSSSATNPASPAKTVSVTVNDGVDVSNTAVATINIAALSITKSASAPTVASGASATLTDAGDKITYTYFITNTGNVALTVAKPVDAGPKFNGVAGTGTLSAFAPVSASIAAGGNQTFTATYTLSAADVMNGAGITNGVTNTANATATAPTGTVTSSNATASTSILTVAGLTVTKTAGAPTTALGSTAIATDAGDTITYTYVVKNVGSVTLTNISPTDAGPKFNSIAGTNALSAFSPASVASLTAGSSTTFTATYTISVTDWKNGVGISNGVTNTASATGKNGATTITAPNSTASTTITAVPSLSITKTFVLTDLGGGTAGKADLGETVTYTYVITNNGNVPMTNVQVKDMHGTPATLVALGAGGITSETLTTPGPWGAGSSSNTTANDGIWDTLAPGASVTFTWAHTVTQAEVDHG
jgi:hypothetical protein